MQPDELDKLFRGGLESHRTPPPRELWERLEDELHPPQQKRRAAWWPLAVAAVVALLLVAGGAGIWGGAWRPAAGRAGEVVTTRPAVPAASGLRDGQKPVETPRATGTMSQPVTREATAVASAELAAISTSKAASKEVGAGTRTRRSGRRPAPVTAIAAAQNFSQKMTLAQATRPHRAASTPSNTGLLVGQLATPHRPQAAVPGSQSASLAATGPRPAPAADGATASVSSPASATPADVIEVEVRRGGDPGTASALAGSEKPVLAAAPPQDGATARPRRGLLRGGLGQQLDGVLSGAGRVVRTARQGYNTLRDLPDNLTVQARVGERTVSKTLEL